MSQNGTQQVKKRRRNSITLRQRSTRVNSLGLLNKSSVLAPQSKLVKNLVNSSRDGRQLISARGGGTDTAWCSEPPYWEALGDCGCFKHDKTSREVSFWNTYLR